MILFILLFFINFFSCSCITKDYIEDIISGTFNAKDYIENKEPFPIEKQIELRQNMRKEYGNRVIHPHLFFKFTLSHMSYSLFPLVAIGGAALRPRLFGKANPTKKIRFLCSVFSVVVAFPFIFFKSRQKARAFQSLLTYDYIVNNFHSLKRDIMNDDFFLDKRSIVENYLNRLKKNIVNEDCLYNKKYTKLIEALYKFSIYSISFEEMFLIESDHFEKTKRIFFTDENINKIFFQKKYFSEEDYKWLALIIEDYYGDNIVGIMPYLENYYCNIFPNFKDNLILYKIIASSPSQLLSQYIFYNYGFKLENNLNQKDESKFIPEEKKFLDLYKKYISDEENEIKALEEDEKKRLELYKPPTVDYADFIKNKYKLVPFKEFVFFLFNNYYYSLNFVIDFFCAFENQTKEFVETCKIFFLKDSTGLQSGLKSLMTALSNLDNDRLDNDSTHHASKKNKSHKEFIFRIMASEKFLKKVKSMTEDDKKLFSPIKESLQQLLSEPYAAKEVTMKENFKECLELLYGND